MKLRSNLGIANSITDFSSVEIPILEIGYTDGVGACSAQLQETGSKIA